MGGEKKALKTDKLAFTLDFDVNLCFTAKTLVKFGFNCFDSDDEKGR
jgi:hypothetical protein